MGEQQSGQGDQFVFDHGAGMRIRAAQAGAINDEVLRAAGATGQTLLAASLNGIRGKGGAVTLQGHPGRLAHFQSKLVEGGGVEVFAARIVL